MYKVVYGEIEDFIRECLIYCVDYHKCLGKVEIIEQNWWGEAEGKDEDYNWRWFVAE